MPNALSSLGSISCILSLATLTISIVTNEWLTVSEPTNQQITKTTFGLFKFCQNKICYNDYNDQSNLVKSIQQTILLTLPFITLSVVFTTGAFLSLSLGYFCKRNKKIIEASLLILAGLCSATALLTFVSQIGSEFDSTSSISTPSKILFYRYKYGSSFYLFLLSFSLSELSGLLSMASFFSQTKQTQTSSPDICTTTTSNEMITFHMNNDDLYFNEEVVDIKIVNGGGCTGNVLSSFKQ